MLFNVPQYIDVEDKVAGPLTAKQLGWLFLMGGILVVMWLMITNKVVFFVGAIPVVFIFVSLAFVRPYGQTLISFVMAGIGFFIMPKIYVWKRTVQASQLPNIATKQKEAKSEQLAKSHEERKEKALENLRGIAKIIDTRGQKYDQSTIEATKPVEIKK